jgi:RHS repeat-associated protein
MQHLGRWLNFWLVLVLLVGVLPPTQVRAVAPTAAQVPSPSAELLPTIAPPQPTANFQLFLPMMARSTPVLDRQRIRLQPDQSVQATLLDGVVQVRFAPLDDVQAVQADLRLTAAPNVQTPGIASAGPTLLLDLHTVAARQAVERLPHQVTFVAEQALFPAVVDVTPSIVLEWNYTAADVWGLDVRSLGIYTRANPDASWQRVPSAVYPDEQRIVAHVETPGEYAPLGLLRQAQVQQTAPKARVALDPDDNVGFAVWPGIGTFRELAFNLRLAEGVRDRLLANGCVDEAPLITRDGTPFVSPQLRIDAMNAYGADAATTLAFNALRGAPWGSRADGGPLLYARGGNDGALAQALLDEVFNYTTRRSTRPILPHGNLPPAYRAFNGLTTTHAHLETLYLDHNFDFPIINTGFDSVIDGVYSGVRRYLEAQGFTCLIDPGDGTGPFPPPYPARPSPEQIQRWRDLGFQNYQRYGMDPVSFSTGNHILLQALARMPGRGGLDFDLTLTYNAQDQRCDILGCSWTFPYNMRLQRYADESVSVVYADGRTMHYEWNGSAYVPPAGGYDRLVHTSTGWELTSRDNETTWVFQETITGLGILSEWRDRRGNALTFTHDLSKEDAWRTGGAVPRPPLTAITDATGRTVTVETDGEGRITAFVLPDGRRFDLDYDNRGDLITITDANTPVRGVHRYEYDERHRIVKQWDPENILFLINEYDDRDRVIKQIDASGTPSYASYDPIARTTTFTDNLGFVYVYTADALNRVIAETDPLNRTVRTTYDTQYNIIARTDARGNTTFFDYDARGNLIERRDPLPAAADVCRSYAYTADVTRWEYNLPDANANLPSAMVNALGQRWEYTYDTEGNLTQVTDPIGTTKATYDGWGQLETFTDANTRTSQFFYDAHGNLERTIDPLNGESRSTYDITGRELSYTDANNNTVKFAYNGNDQITAIIDPKGAVSTFAYDLNNLLLSATDRNGVTRSFRYDENLKLIGELDHPGGVWAIYAYDKLYRRIADTDRIGSQTAYGYDSAGQLEQLIEANGAITGYGYDADGNLTRITDALGGTTLMAYDEVGRLAATTDAAGSSVTYCYDAEDRLIASVGPRSGEIYTFSYDALDRLEAIRDPQGNLRQFAHDSVGNRTAEITPLGDRTDLRYDALDRLIAIERPLLPDGTRPTTRFGYDAVGNTTEITSPRGFTTRMEYDKNDNLAQLVDALGGITRYSYDAEDRPLTITDPNGNATTLTYDPVGNLLTIRNALGETTRMAYDPAYNMVRQVSPMGQPTDYSYNAVSELVQVRDPLGNTTTYRRDLLGRVTGVRDAAGRTTGYSYDPVGRLLAVTDALGGATRYAYDEAGNLVSISDAKNRTTRFTHDLLNQLTGEVNPLGNTWRYAYDPNGRLNQRLDALGRPTNYEYDSNDRLVGVSYGAPAAEQAPLRFAYDLDGNETQMCDGLGCHSTSYDALGRVVAATDWQGATVRRSYDAAGNLTQLLYPGGRPVRYAYDEANRIAGIRDPRGGTSTYQRNANGQVTTIRHPNATRSSYSYDAAQRLIALDHRREGAATPQNAYAFALDRVGNRTQVQETRAAFDGSNQLVTLTRDFGYDALDRLTRAASDVGSDTAYSFDAVGNRLNRDGTALTPDPGLPELPVAAAPVAETSRYNAANQLVQHGASSFDFDRNGNRREQRRTLPNGQIELTIYRYDREDRLIGVTRQVGERIEMEATYRYDGYGRRVSKDVRYPAEPVRNQRITYTYDGLDIIAAEVNEGGQVRELAFYLAPSPLTGLRRPYAMEELGSRARYWFQTDGLDSIIALTDERGAIVSPLLYDEYGNQLAGSTVLHLFGHTAQPHDPETGLQHFYARYYDPATGVWLTQDPYRGRIDIPVTLHRYGYVGANPMTWVDAWGYDRQQSSGLSYYQGRNRTSDIGCSKNKSCNLVRTSVTQKTFNEKVGCGISMSCTKGQAIVFVDKEGARIPLIGSMVEPAGHVAWAYEHSPGCFVYGSTDNPNGGARSPSQQKGIWKKFSCNLDEVWSEMKDKGYDDYKVVNVVNPQAGKANNAYQKTTTLDYNVFGRNCMDDTYDVLRAYGANLPDPSKNWRPNDFYDRTQSRNSIPYSRYREPMPTPVPTPRPSH